MLFCGEDSHSLSPFRETTLTAEFPFKFEGTKAKESASEVGLKTNSNPFRDQIRSFWDDQ